MKWRPFLPSMLVLLLVLSPTACSADNTTLTPPTTTLTPTTTMMKSINAGDTSSPGTTAAPFSKTSSPVEDVTLTTAGSVTDTTIAGDSTTKANLTQSSSPLSSNSTLTTTTVSNPTTILTSISLLTSSSNGIPTTTIVSSTTNNKTSETNSNSTSALPSTTSARNNITSTPNPTSTTVTIMTASSSTSSTTTTAVATSTTILVPVEHTNDVVISETNILLTTSESLFVELQGTEGESLSGFTLVILDGTDAAEKMKVDFLNKSSSVFPKSGILTQEIKSTDQQALESVKLAVVALYPTKMYNSSAPHLGFVNFTILSTDPAVQLDPRLKETMLPHGQPFVVSTGLSASQNLSLSRCSRDQGKSSMFVLSQQSRDQPNVCNLTAVNDTYTLQLQSEDDNCQTGDTGDNQRQQVETQLVSEINRRCRCGMTTWLIHGSLSCARDLFLDFTLEESYKGQAKQVIGAFSNFIGGNLSITVGRMNYTVVNCTSRCHRTSPHNQPDKANTSMTVAVVLSCVAVFLIILVAVILYMRGRKRGLIKQFRMTRLQEDDDMDDMDDFIGGGEASFSSRS